MHNLCQCRDNYFTPVSVSVIHSFRFSPAPTLMKTCTWGTEAMVEVPYNIVPQLWKCLSYSQVWIVLKTKVVSAFLYQCVRTQTSRQAHVNGLHCVIFFCALHAGYVPKRQTVTLWTDVSIVSVWAQIIDSLLTFALNQNTNISSRRLVAANN